MSEETIEMPTKESQSPQMSFGIANGELTTPSRISENPNGKRIAERVSDRLMWQEAGLGQNCTLLTISLDGKVKKTGFNGTNMQITDEEAELADFEAKTPSKYEAVVVDCPPVDEFDAYEESFGKVLRYSRRNMGRNTPLYALLKKVQDGNLDGSDARGIISDRIAGEIKGADFNSPALLVGRKGDDYLLETRTEKPRTKRKPLNLLEHEKLGPLMKIFLERVKNFYGKQLYTVDASSLIAELEQSKVPPRSIYNAYHGLNVTVTSPEGCVFKIAEETEDGKSTHEEHRCEDKEAHVLNNIPDESERISARIKDGVNCSACNSHTIEVIDFKGNMYDSSDPNSRGNVALESTVFCNNNECEHSKKNSLGTGQNSLMHSVRVIPREQYLELMTDVNSAPDQQIKGFFPREQTFIPVRNPEREMDKKESERPEAAKQEAEGPYCGDFPEHGEMKYDEQRRLYLCSHCASRD